MTIGNIITLYDSLKEAEAKDLVANAYGCSRGVFYNYMETIRVLRNKCAHSEVVFTVWTFLKESNVCLLTFLPNADTILKGGIDVARYMLGCISQSRKKDLENDIQNLVSSIQTPEAQKVIAQVSKIES